MVATRAISRHGWHLVCSLKELCSPWSFAHRVAGPMLAGSRPHALLLGHGVGRETAVDEKAIPLFGGSWSDWQMAGTGRFNIAGDGVLESEGGPGLFWYSRAAFADFVLCVDWRLSSFEDNSGVHL